MKVARVEAIGQLSPLERGRHRSSGFGAHAVGTSDGLALDVLQVVDVNRCGTASFDESLDRRQIRAFIARGVLKLNGGDADISHSRPI